MEYKTLEGDSIKTLGIQAPTFKVGETASFLATSTFVYTLFFVAIIIASFYRYVVAGAYRMQASETAIRQSNEIIKRVTLGLLGVFSLFLILFTVNKGLVRGDVGLQALSSSKSIPKTQSVSSAVSTGGVSGGRSRSCETLGAIITKIGGGNICSGTVCTALNGCNWKQYESIIDGATKGDSRLKKMTIVTMCKESSAIKNSSHKNEDMTFDCGLMQINQKNSCTDASFSVTENITAGVKLLKQLMSASSQTYPSVPSVAGVFASYNCCSNGTIPNAPSSDCNNTSGFENKLPKWACPINPGESTYNMCSVKSYACELATCMDML